MQGRRAVVVVAALVVAVWLLDVAVLSVWSTEPSSFHWSRVALPVVAASGLAAAALQLRWAARATSIVALLTCGMACLEVAFEVDGSLRAGWTLQDGLAGNRFVSASAAVAVVTAGMVVAALRLARALRDRARSGGSHGSVLLDA